MKGTKRIFSFLLIISILSTIIMLPVTVSAETKVVDYSCEIVDGIMRVTANVEVDGSNTSYRTGGIIVTGYDEYGNAIETQSAFSTIMVGGSKKTLTVDMEAGTDIKSVTVMPNKGVTENEVRSFGKRMVDGVLRVTASIEVAGTRTGYEVGGITVVGYDNNGNAIETQSAYNALVIGSSGKTLTVDMEAGDNIKTVKVFPNYGVSQNTVTGYGKRLVDNNIMRVTANIEVSGSKNWMQVGGVVVTGYDKFGNAIETQSAYSSSISGQCGKTFTIDMEAGADIKSISVVPNKGVTKNEVRSFGKRMVDSVLRVTASIEVAGSQNWNDQGGVLVVGYDALGNIIETRSAYDPIISGLCGETLTVDMQAGNQIKDVKVFTDIDPINNKVRCIGKRQNDDKEQVTTTFEVPGSATGYKKIKAQVVGYDAYGNVVESHNISDSRVLGGSIETYVTDFTNGTAIKNIVVYDENNNIMPSDINHTSSDIGIGTKKTNTTVIMQRGNNLYNLLTEHQIFSKNSTEKVTITVSPDWQNKPSGRILLSQGGIKYIESESGIFENICPADIFDSNGKICVALITADGETIEFQPIQLQITSTENSSQTSASLSKGTIKLFEDFGVDVPDTVPIIGGSKYGISLGSLSTDFEVDGSDFKVTIGSTVLDGKKGTDGKWKKEDWQGLKSGFKDAKEKLLKGVSNYNFLKNIASKGTKLELQNGVGGNVTVLGYLEGSIDEKGQMRIFEGGIIVAGEIKYTYQGMVIVGVVPLYYEVGAGGELEFVGGVKGYVPNEGIAKAFTGSVTPSVFAEAGGGIGVPYVMTAGVSGKVEIALEVALERVYQKLAVEGSALFQWKGPFNVVLDEKEFAKGTWYIYETGNPNTLLGSTVGLFSLRDMYNGIDLDSPVQLEDRSYILEPSEWIGGVSNDISLFAVDYTNKQLALLEENTYKDAAPIIANMQGTKVMAWITDNSGREAVNKSMLVYSVYDEEKGVWSSPVSIADDGTADFYPEMKDGYIVWQKANTEFDETASINDMSKSSEIYIAKWNGSSFDEAVRVTNNSTIDTKPTLAVKNDVAHIVWTTNTEDNFMGTAGTNSILSCSFDGSNLGEQSTIASELTAITNMSASYTDALNVYYVTDTDNDYATVTDRDIYSLSGTETTQVTSNSTLDSNPVAVDVNGEEWLFWYSEGNIMYKKATDTFTVFDNAQSGITDDFDVITNGSGNIVITWTTVNDGGAEIQGVFYDGEAWSKDIQISELGENVKYPHGIMDENGIVTLAFNRTQKIATDDYYTDGQADLCTLQVTPSYDIAVDDAMLGSYELIVGENSLLVDISNKGELSVTSYTVQITDEKGNQLGEYVSETSLLAGEKKTIDVSFTIDETFTAQNIFATISAENIDEYNVDNNSTSVEVGSADAKIAGTAIGENKVSVTVKNAGFENANGITVALLAGTSTTPQTKTIETIASKEATVVEFDVDLSSLAFDEDSYGALTVTLSADADSNESNNETTINVSKSAIENYYEVTLHSVANTTKGCIINANVKNNLQYSRNAIVIAAIYNSNNALVEVKMEEKELVTDDYTTVDFSFEGVTLDKTQTIKLFLWANSGSVKPIGSAKEYLCSDYIK